MGALSRKMRNASKAKVMTGKVAGQRRMSFPAQSTHRGGVPFTSPLSKGGIVRNYSSSNPDSIDAANDSNSGLMEPHAHSADSIPSNTKPAMASRRHSLTAGTNHFNELLPHINEHQAKSEATNSSIMHATTNHILGTSPPNTSNRRSSVLSQRSPINSGQSSLARSLGNSGGTLPRQGTSKSTSSSAAASHNVAFGGTRHSVLISSNHQLQPVEENKNATFGGAHNEPYKQKKPFMHTLSFVEPFRDMSRRDVSQLRGFLYSFFFQAFNAQSRNLESWNIFMDVLHLFNVICTPLVFAWTYHFINLWPICLFCVMDILFLWDCFIRSRTSYRDDYGSLVIDLNVIKSRYLWKRFGWLDVLSSLPWELFPLFLEEGGKIFWRWVGGGYEASYDTLQ
jgi:hypothetical protein